MAIRTRANLKLLRGSHPGASVQRAVTNCDRGNFWGKVAGRQPPHGELIKELVSVERNEYISDLWYGTGFSCDGVSGQGIVFPRSLLLEQAVSVIEQPRCRIRCMGQ